MGTQAPTTKTTRQAGESINLFTTDRPIAQIVELYHVANIVILLNIKDEPGVQ